MEIPILYSDKDLLIVNKPNNVLVHSSYYARNIKEPSLIELLQARFDEKLYTVHRLDYKTSGVIIIAKSATIAGLLQKQFESTTIKKTYLALLRGYLDEEGIIDTPVKNPENGKYKEALTHYKNLESVEVNIAVKPYDKSRYSLVEFYPQTGRMHQLRIHANKISHPIIGDHKYGNRHHNKMFEVELECGHLFLHANEISFEHPTTKKTITYSAKVPLTWKYTMDKLGFKQVL